MKNLIIDIQHSLLEPIIKEIEKNYLKQLRSEEQEISKENDLILKEIAKKDTQTFVDFVLGRDELDLIETGFQLAINNLDQLPNQSSILENLKKCSLRFIHGDQSLTETEPHLYDTLAELFDIKKETYDGFYQIGAQFFNQGEFEKALGIFLLLTHLNPMVFEPWLGLGVCWQKNDEPVKALTAFSMASIVFPKHPAPHIHSAEVYVMIEQNDLAEQTLQYAKRECEAEQLQIYQQHIAAIEKQLKEN